MNIINEIEKEQMRTDLPQFNVGDTIRVNYRVVEGNKEGFSLMRA
jgi:LSU ribosomal protein L19P